MQLMQNEFYHLVNRGVDKRVVFLDDKDRLRFIHNLFSFNDADHSDNYIQPTRRSGKYEFKRRKNLVTIHAFALMDNHYHILVSPMVEDGVSIFMKKINMGYTKYFNERHKRTGTLWQGKYRKVMITKDSHFLYLPHYIHLNPLDYKFPEWRKGKVDNIEEAIEYLDSYRWSSHMDYSGIKNFPSIINTKLLKQIIGEGKKYYKNIGNIMSSKDWIDSCRVLESSIRK